MSDISELIKKMISNERASDLLEIMMGMSEFNMPTSSKEAMTAEEQKLWQMALLHLQFVSKYGVNFDEVDDDGKQHFSYFSEFDDWIAAGHPGVERQEVLNYIEAKPL